jgi:lanosterol synthase
MLTAQYVIAHAFLGRPIPPARKRRVARYFERARLASGVWGLHDHAGASLFTTTLVYVAARLVGVAAEDPRLAEARHLFDDHDVGAVPTWGRVWLALLGLYGWEGVQPMPPELWALPHALPVHPSRLYCHTRQIYLALSLLRAAAPSAAHPLTPALRAELFPRRRYDAIDFRALRAEVSSLDRAAPEHPLLGLFYRGAELFARLPATALRERVGDELRARIRWELSTTDHMALSPVSGLLGILALHVADPGDPAIDAGLAALEAWAFEDEEDGFRITGARSQTWDTAFALEALSAARPEMRHDPRLEAAFRFLAAQQIEAPFDGHRWAYRVDPSGGFCFAHVGHGWPVSDCTAEALLALAHAPERLALDPARFHMGVAFMLRCQNRDGGFGSYEARRTELPLEALNPSEMFLDCMTEGSYVECTASCVAALAEHAARFPAHPLAPSVRRALARASAHLRRTQRGDGAWDAAWGVHSIYGALFGVRGLRAAGAPPHDPAIVRATRFLLYRQRPDGGFGEHESGALLGRYVALPESQSVQTAWALLALLASGAGDVDVAMHRAARFLLERQAADGAWPKERMAGVFFRTALVDYTLYRAYFPLWALGLYAQRLRARAGAPLSRAGDDGGSAATRAPE